MKTYRILIDCDCPACESTLIEFFWSRRAAVKEVLRIRDRLREGGGHPERVSVVEKDL